MNYVPFAEAIMEMVVELYKATGRHNSVIQAKVLQNILKVIPTLHTHHPLTL